MAAVTSRLNDAGVPFQLKALNHPARCPGDTVVLYVRPTDWAQAVDAVQAAWVAAGQAIGEDVPGLTRRLAAGIGAAEDPGGAESFGTHRSRLIADGLIRAWEPGARRLADRTAAVVERLVEEAIDIERPYESTGTFVSRLEPLPPLRTAERRAVAPRAVGDGAGERPRPLHRRHRGGGGRELRGLSAALAEPERASRRAGRSPRGGVAGAARCRPPERSAWRAPVGCSTRCWPRKPKRDVQVYAVWFNVLPTDSRGRWDPELFDDPRVTEFWDPAGTVGDYFAEHRDAMGLDFFGGVIVWDVSLLFGPDASWDTFPTPVEHFGYTVWGERRGLRRQLETLWAEA